MFVIVFLLKLQQNKWLTSGKGYYCQWLKVVFWAVKWLTEKVYCWAWGSCNLWYNMSYIDKIISITACQQVLFLFLFSLCFIYNKSYSKGAFIHEYDGALLPCSEGEIYISLTGNLCKTTWSFKMDSLQTVTKKKLIFLLEKDSWPRLYTTLTKTFCLES